MCQMWIHLNQLILVHDLKLLNVTLLENMDRNIYQNTVNVFSSITLLFVADKKKITVLFLNP